jgi:ATP-binding cassette subfamily B multidrug efflux pump
LAPRAGRPVRAWGGEAAIRSLYLLIPYLRRYRGRIVAGLAATLVATAFSRLIPWFLKLAIDSLREGGSLTQALRMAGAMVAAATLGAFFLYLQRWWLIGASREVEYDLRADLFRHLQRLDLDYFGRRKTGDLMAHFTNDLVAIRMVAGPGIMYAATMSLTLVLSIALMVAIDPLLTVLAFAPYPLISVVTFLFGREMHPRSRRVQDLFGNVSARVQEDISGMRVIRAYTQEESCAANFARLNDAYLDANMDVARLRSRFMAGMNALAGIGLVVALLVGGRQVIDGRLSLGSLVALSAYLVELTWPVIAIGWVITMYQRGASAAARLKELLAIQPGILSGPRADRPAPRVAFENVTFRYGGAATDALCNVSFHLEPGQTLGIVGRTGSGKSTVLRLLLRLYEPAAGRILVDGIDIRERDLGALRAVTGYAPQDAFLFSRTVAENIAYGRPEAPPEQIREMARGVRLHGEIEAFTERYDTLVGERGITLSGGQRQRLSLARALLLEPDLLLLDDTLSSVDTETEAAMLTELRRYLQGRTAIIVSHRISAVEHADWILVLEQGTVTEEGMHEQLLRGGGLYSRLYERQRLAAEIEMAGSGGGTGS